MADFIKEIGHDIVGSPSVTPSKIFSLTISFSEWYPSRKTTRERNTCFRRLELNRTSQGTSGGASAETAVAAGYVVFATFRFFLVTEQSPDAQKSEDPWRACPSVFSPVTQHQSELCSHTPCLRDFLELDY